MNNYAVYQNRDLLLKEVIGYKNYRSYLSSKLWKEIRERTRNKYNFICQCCKLDLKGAEKYLHVHHEKYTEDNLSGDSDIGLMLVCMWCHLYAEKDRGKKRPLEEANRTLRTPRKPTKRALAIVSDLKKGIVRPSKPKRAKKNKKAKKGWVKKYKQKKCCSCKQLAPKNHDQCKTCRLQGKPLKKFPKKGSVTICGADKCYRATQEGHYLCEFCAQKKELNPTFAVAKSDEGNKKMMVVP